MDCQKIPTHKGSSIKKTSGSYAATCLLLTPLQKKYPVDFDDELKIGDVRYDNTTQIPIKVQLFWRLPYEMWLSLKMNRF